MRECPECGEPLEKMVDWPDEWLYCKNCLETVSETEYSEDD